MRVLIRLSGEVNTKSRATRARFVRRLVRNIKDALQSEQIPYHLERSWSRIFVEASDDRVVDVLRRIYGIQSLSVVDKRPARTLEDVVLAGEAIFRDRVRGRSFAVRARRGGNKAEIPFTSKDVENALGTALLEHARKVDLDRPEVTAYVEVRNGHAYFFTERIDGPGGLPLGTEARAVALVSGGFDSLVAAWFVLKRGVALDYVFCNMGGAAHVESVVEVLKVLSDRWSYGTRPKLHVVDFRPLIEELQAKTKTSYWQVLLKRLMYRVAERIAVSTGGTGIVTGESIGQVSSQTLQNLHVISQACTLPLLRPLVGFDKHEIILHARDIGTHDLSASVEEYCALVPEYPVTRASLEVADEEEQKLDPACLERAIHDRKILELRGLDTDAWPVAAEELEEIPAGAVIVDLRPRSAYEAWHFPDAIHMPFPGALKKFEALDRDATYAIYCEVGFKSAHLAERMRESDYRAFSVKGGMKTVIREAVKRELVLPEELPEDLSAL